MADCKTPRARALAARLGVDTPDNSVSVELWLVPVLEKILEKIEKVETEFKPNKTPPLEEVLQYFYGYEREKS